MPDELIEVVDTIVRAHCRLMPDMSNAEMKAEFIKNNRAEAKKMGLVGDDNIINLFNNMPNTEH